MSDYGLIVFAKRPAPGQVKTRLAAVLGAAAACEIYQLLLEDLLSRLPRNPRIVIAFDPPDALDAMQRICAPLLPASAEFRAQASGDLGLRLLDQFEAAFRGGMRKVIAIGSDCAALEERHLAQAARLLDERQVVLGPSLDGGYYLIGLTHCEPKLFADMPWSSDRLLGCTLTAIEKCGMTCHLLETLADLDVAEDLPGLPQRLRIKIRGKLGKLSI